MVLSIIQQRHLQPQLLSLPDNLDQLDLLQGKAMNTVIKYAVAAAIIGFFPGSIIILIPLEIAMVYHLSIIHKRPFNLGELGLICTALVTVGGGPCRW